MNDSQASAAEQELINAVTKQGEVVRELKSSKADKTQVEAAVAALLALKVTEHYSSLITSHSSCLD